MLASNLPLMCCYSTQSFVCALKIPCQISSDSSPLSAKRLSVLDWIGKQKEFLKIMLPLQKYVCAEGHDEGREVA